MSRLPAAEVRDALLDRGSFCRWDTTVEHHGASPQYRAELGRAAERAGYDESAMTGTGLIGGTRVAVILSEFNFLGGSIGEVAGQRIREAIERATVERLPLIALPASGGTRMQEGTLAFLQMVEITRAIVAHQDARLPYITYLRDPTMGGVFASWGSMGDLTMAEPRATVGFLGPRVHHALTGEEFPAGVQTAENLRDRGIVDAVVTLPELRSTILGVLAHTAHRKESFETHPSPRAPEAGRPPVGATPPPSEPVGGADRSIWARVEATRRRDHITIGQLLARMTDIVPLAGSDEDHIRAGFRAVLARVDGISVVVIGHDRDAQAQGYLIGPRQIAAMTRIMSVAERWRLPLVTCIDTPGAELSADAENGGLAVEIARSIARLVDLKVPSVSVLLGQGAGGAALSLFPAGARIAIGTAWLAPLPPEGASVISYRDTDHTPQMVERQRIGAIEMLQDGALSAVVPSRETDSVGMLAESVVAEIHAQLVRQLA